MAFVLSSNCICASGWKYCNKLTSAFFAFCSAETVLAKDIGILGLYGDGVWVAEGILIADDGVHGGLVAKVVLDVGMQVLKSYFGHSADGYLWEDGLHYACDGIFLSFLHELEEWVEEVECHW